MRSHKSHWIALLVLFTFAIFKSANAALVATNLILVIDPDTGGQIEVISTINDNYFGDFSKWQWDYQIHNISYDPTPGISNGLSGFNLVFAGSTNVMNQYAPAGWIFNCCGTTPPFGAEYDIQNSSGLGIMPGQIDHVGFATAAGTPWTDVYHESWSHSWEGDIQTLTFNTQDVASGLGPLVPAVPVPAAVWLFGSGLLGLIGIARRKAA